MKTDYESHLAACLKSTEDLFPLVNWPKREAGHSHVPEDKDVGPNLHFPIRLHSVVCKFASKISSVQNFSFFFMAFILLHCEVRSQA